MVSRNFYCPPAGRSCMTAPGGSRQPLELFTHSVNVSGIVLNIGYCVCEYDEACFIHTDMFLHKIHTTGNLLIRI
jgi:hypothetical protein